MDKFVNKSVNKPVYAGNQLQLTTVYYIETYAVTKSQYGEFLFVNNTIEHNIIMSTEKRC